MREFWWSVLVSLSAVDVIHASMDALGSKDGSRWLDCLLSVCTIFSLRGCVHVRLCALKHLRCIYSCSEWIVVNFSFSFFPLCRQSFGLLWLWFFRLDTLSVSVSVDCVHSTLAEARCVLVVLCILLILHHEPIRLKTAFIERKKYFLFMATSWSFFGW